VPGVRGIGIKTAAEQSASGVWKPFEPRQQDQAEQAGETLIESAENARVC
jgi:hypothetical protein